MATSTETRWIEAESLHLDHDSRCLDEHNDKDNEAAAIDETWTDLFADPDPYETFTYQWNINVDRTTLQSSDGPVVGGTTIPNSSPPLPTTTIGVSVTGHKAENGQTLHSTGLTVWRASQILADWLVQCHTSSATTTQRTSSSSPCPWTRPLAQCTVLELGAGLGVPGLVCHLLGAPVVVLTDGDTDTLANLRRNVARNSGQTATAADHGNEDTATRTHLPHISCHQLVWGNSEQINNALHCLRSLAEESLPEMESNNDHHRYFDVILGSDIIYVEHVIEPLFDTVSQLLDKSSGVFLLAYCRRNVSVSLVLSAALRRGMVWHEPDAPDGVYQFWYPPPGGSTR
jgi:predicted nicotinamide N-methyase